MKKIVIKISALAFLLSLAFLNISCGGGTFVKNEFFFIELHDENDKTIAKKEDLEAFNLSLLDNYSGNKFDGKISLEGAKYGDTGEVGHIYLLYFHLGIGHFETTAKRYDKKFKKQMEKTGLRIVDKQGRYKTYEIYPLSNYIEYSDEMKNIIVKLEKK